MQRFIPSDTAYEMCYYITIKSWGKAIHTQSETAPTVNFLMLLVWMTPTRHTCDTLFKRLHLFAARGIINPLFMQAIYNEAITLTVLRIFQWQMPQSSGPQVMENHLSRPSGVNKSRG